MEQIYQEAKRNKSPMARVFQSGYIELQRLLEKERSHRAPEPSLLEKPLAADAGVANLDRALTRAIRLEMLGLEKYLPTLATTASTAPFIGLFGTVWGILHAFQTMGSQGSASLPAVASGISEALITTAIGILCAIPSAVGYNLFLNRVRGLRTQMDNFGGDFLNIVRRNFLTA